MRLDERVAPDTSTMDDVPSGRARPPKRRRGRLGVAVLVVLAVVLGLVGTNRYADDIGKSVQAITADEPRAVSGRVVLDDLWRVYKQTYLEKGTSRTIDRQSDGITTSEGESYTLLRSVWTDDLQTFTDSWQWTKDNLQRDDFLLAWKFGRRADGSYGIQNAAGGGNTATDADVDTAFALLMAYSRWKQDVFLYDALPLITSIWEKEVVSVDGAPVLVANDLERFNPVRLVLNPSYFAPYAYRVFAKVDPAHDWLGLVDNSYAILQTLSQQPLDADRSAGLPPDWVVLNRLNGEFSSASDTLTTRFSYDALRLPWRLALDYRWYGEERGRQLLDREAVLARQWTANHRLVAAYNRDGTPAVDYGSPAMYGGAMGYFAVVQPALADEVYTDALLPFHDADTGNLTGPLGYYDSNWVWFGMALYLDQLPNLTVTDE
ncbi:endoglucanase [Modestobacter sp. DSM 44400]|uniref:glycosyl hydrolase family 8 n=1 Tax=Modestobacter sp. DSM 44400 TaxID=1550230 RepID=UPI000894FCC5|nr:glycosyl hydrolase family 8 [Modestobacter sp. DSM 44400]SDX96566.1 endoglucanase [Modestobacter sp. DSM 44400]